MRLQPERVGGPRPLSASFATSAAILGLSLLTGVLLARVLGPHDRGALAAVLLWPGMLATIGSLGVVDAIVFHAARSAATVAALAGTSVVIAVAQSALLVGIGASILPIVLSGYGEESVRAGLLLLAYIPLNLLALYLMAILNGLHRFCWFQSLRLVTVGVTAAALVGLTLAGALTVTTAALAYLAANLLTCLAAAVLVHLACAGRLAVSRSLGRELLAYGLRTHVGTCSSALNERLDQLAISVFLGPVQLGLYVVAVTLSSVATLVGSSASLIALPAVARLEPGAERTAAARRLVVLTTLGSAAVAIPGVVLAPKVISLCFGDEFRGAAPVARVLLVAAVLLAAGRVLGAVLKAVDRPLDAGVAELLGLGVTVAALAILLPGLGLLGAGLASLLAYAVATVWMARRAGRSLELPIAAFVLPRRQDVGPAFRAAAKGVVR